MKKNRCNEIRERACKVLVRTMLKKPRESVPYVLRRSEMTAIGMCRRIYSLEPIDLVSQ